jgi:parvulin-like peptidyl-prolyl isomerase
MKWFQPSRIVCAAFALAVALAGCGKKPAADVLARVGDTAITVADFKAEYQRRLDLHQPLPDRQTLLEQMVERETWLQQARAAGLANDAEVRRAAEDALIRRFQETRVAPQIAAVKVAPEEIQAVYDRDAAHYAQPEKVKLAILHFAADAKADSNQVAVAETRARAALAQAALLPVDVRDFGSLAADASDDQLTRYRGGDAGWFADDGLATRWPKEILAAGFALKTSGALSPVLRGPDGFYLVKKMDARPASVTPLAQVRAAIERRLLAEKRQAVERQLNLAARAAVQVSTDAGRLAAVDYPNLNPGPSAPVALPALSVNP